MDLAVRFRELRERSGLTASALAGNRYSVSYVSRIEAGGRRPSRDAMAYFAKRLGVSPGFLATGVPDGLEKRLMYNLEEARRDLRRGSPQQAEAKARAVLSRAQQYEMSSLVARAQGLLGEALGSQGRLKDAIDLLEESLEAGLPPLEEARLAGALARAYASIGDLTYAAELAERLMARLEGQGLDPGFTTELCSALSDIYLERGDLARAEALGRRALAGADAMSSLEARADVYWQASRVLAQAAQWDEALDLVARARTLAERSDEGPRVGRLHHAYAHLCLEAEPPRLEEARRHLALAEARLTEASSAEDVVLILIERSRLALLEGNSEEALELAQRAASSAALESRSLGRSLLLKGRSEGVLGQDLAARQSLTEAARVFASHGDRRQQAECWRQIGELALRSGDVDGAADALRIGLEAFDQRRSRA